VVLPAIHLQTPRPLSGRRIDPLLSSNNRLNLPTISPIVPFAFLPSRLSAVSLCPPRTRFLRFHRALTPMRVRACARSHKIIYTTRREAGCSNYESRRERALIQKIAAYFRPIILRTGSPCPSSSVRAFRHGHRWPPDESLNFLPPPISLSFSAIASVRSITKLPSSSSTCLPRICSCRSSCS